jgi:hypothetical protein
MNGLYLSLLAIGVVFATGFLWFRLAFAVALPENRAGFVSSMALGVSLGVSGLVLGSGLLNGTLAVLSLLLGGFFIFTFLISAQKGGSGALQIGSPLLTFSTTDQQGDTFDSSSLEGRPVLLKFFRGHW